VVRSLDAEFNETMGLEWEDFQTPAVSTSLERQKDQDDGVVQTPRKQFTALSPEKEKRKADKNARKLARRQERAKQAELVEEEEETMPLSQRNKTQTASEDEAEAQDTKSESLSILAEASRNVRRSSLPGGAGDQEARAQAKGKANGSKGRGKEKEASPDRDSARGRPLTVGDFLK
jgi:hypothetical protein